MDIVKITGLEAEATIGVLDWERCIRQKVIMNIELSCDIKPAAKDDDLHLAVDYSSVAAVVTSLVETSEFELIESLAETITHQILADFKVEKVGLEVIKPGAVKNAKAVGLIIERSRS